MTIVQYRMLLNGRGITELPRGKTIADMVKETGGEPNFEEMMKVNEQAMNHYMNLNTENIAKIEELTKLNLSLKNKIETYEKEIQRLKTPEEVTKRRDFVASSEDERSLAFLRCLKNAGVDNWEGYSFAQDMFEKENREV